VGRGDFNRTNVVGIAIKQSKIKKREEKRASTHGAIASTRGIQRKPPTEEKSLSNHCERDLIKRAKGDRCLMEWPATRGDRVFKVRGKKKSSGDKKTGPG